VTRPAILASVWDYVWAAITIAFFSIPLALSLWALLDAARRPGWAWALCGRSQVVWMASILCGVLCVIPGLVISLWYLLKVRPVVAAAEGGRFAG
jgi:hypothetical protein